MAGEIDSARLGRAAEYLVAAKAILASDLRLNVSTSFVDDEGVDLVFHRRGSTTTLAVQVKSRTVGAQTIAKKGVFRAIVRTSTFAARADFFLLFVLVDKSSGTFPYFWLIPSRTFRSGVKPVDGGRRFAASVKPDTGDRWRKFRFVENELAPRILAILDGLDDLTQEHSSK